MRLIFIPGFGEEPFIFDQLHPRLPGEKLFLSLWNELPDSSLPALNVSLFAQELAKRYNITAADIVIGHSTGGWVALFLKQHTGCRIVQIASWTDRRKVVNPAGSRRLLFWFAKSGFFFNHTVLRWSLNRRYRNYPSAPVFTTVFTRLSTGNKNNVVNQLRLIFNPVQEGAAAVPDVSIHAQADPIVRCPEGAYFQVPGDHFCLYTYPDAVAAPIIEFLNKQHKA